MTTALARWWGPELDPEQRSLVDMLDALTAGHGLEIEDESSVGELIRELAELGIWTLGIEESEGGGGADPVTTMLAIERLGRAWPALGWAAVQAHVAVDVLAGTTSGAKLIEGIHAGLCVAIADATSPHVAVTACEDGRLQGRLERIDASSEAPYLVILTDRRSAIVVDPQGLEFEPLQRTGLGGAFSRSVSFDVGPAGWFEIDDVDTARARTQLRRGAAVVAAGIAAAAADDSVGYSQERVQFGAPLTALPTVRSSLLGQVSGSVVSLAAALNASDPLTALIAMREATDHAVTVAAAHIQSHGGYGYLTEYRAERRLRDAVSLRAAVDVPAAALTAAHLAAGTGSGAPE